MGNISEYEEYQYLDKGGDAVEEKHKSLTPFELIVAEYHADDIHAEIAVASYHGRERVAEHRDCHDEHHVKALRHGEAS